MAMQEPESSYIATLDIGTTTVRCHVIDSFAKTVGKASIKVKLLYPQEGYVEMNPDDFLADTVQVVKDAISDANLEAKDIKCLAIATQRSTFINWRKDNGKHLHNFITWKDMRATDLIKDINDSYLIKLFQSAAAICNIIGFLGKNNRYLTASRLKLTNTQCTGRLLWVLQNMPKVAKAVERKNLCFGTIDTWLIYKLTGGDKHIVELSLASSTGLFDPFILKWSDWPSMLLNIPKNILPEVVDSDYDFGRTTPGIFGVSIPIKCVIADQQASMFGTFCLNENDIKVTMGTGSFIDINTGEEAIAVTDTIYPLIGWKLNDKITYLAEAACKDAGSLIEWALKIGIAPNVTGISMQAYNVNDSDGVFFIPAFSGLGPPITDDKAASGFIGVKPTTTSDHLVRALLESIAYTIILAYNTLIIDKSKEICVDGGVSNCDFICQLLAEMCNRKVVRYRSHEKTVLGAAFIAGLNAGIWKSTKELYKFRTIDKIFKPNVEKYQYHNDNLKTWLAAIKRFNEWY